MRSDVARLIEERRHTMKRLEVVRAVVLHHTDTRPSASPESLRAYHVLRRGWADIGYHIVVTPDGDVFRGRPEEYQGAHAYSSKIQEGRNHDSIGIAVVGTYIREMPPVAALRAVLQECGRLWNTHGQLRILGHQRALAELGDPDHTDCPGMVEWVAWVRDRLPGPLPEAPRFTL